MHNRFKMLPVLCATCLIINALKGVLVLAEDDEGIIAYRYPIGDIKTCLINPLFQKTLRYQVLPGMGWDNLENKDAGLLVVYNYSQCKTTDDGKYLLPDSIVTVPIKRSYLESYAEMFEHWSNYTSLTSRSINIGGEAEKGTFGISGKFSSESQNVKMKQVSAKSVTTRVQARYVRYAAKLQPDTPLSPTFKKRLHNIAANIQLNKTAMATYESQLLVRDFGTHVVTSVDAGAIIGRLDEIKASFTRNREYSKSEILASASATFFIKNVSAKLTMDYSQVTSKENIEQYLGNRTHSEVFSFGGPVYKPIDFSLDQWAEEMENELVAIDKAGDPIYFLITPQTLPELSPSILYDLTEYVKTAVEHYYKFNLYEGCTKADSPSFSFVANVDDGTCESSFTNYTFGGVYQTCHQIGLLNQDHCSALQQKNPLTGDFSCPENYESVLIHKGHRLARQSRRSCSYFLFIKIECSDNFEWAKVIYTSYWCIARGSVQQYSGFQFGGLYTDKVPNLLTGSKNCPLFFYPLKMGVNLKICVSDDFELGFRYSVPFAGFFSCKTGNPLMTEKASIRSQDLKLAYYLKTQSNWPKGCPNGYSSHLATVENDCEINYCVKAHAFSSYGLPPVRKPPFVDLPSDAYIDKETEYDFEISHDYSTWTSTPSENDTDTKGNVIAILLLICCGIIVVSLVFISISIGICRRRGRKLNAMKQETRMSERLLTLRNESRGPTHDSSA